MLNDPGLAFYGSCARYNRNLRAGRSTLSEDVQSQPFNARFQAPNTTRPGSFSYFEFSCVWKTLINFPSDRAGLQIPIDQILSYMVCALRSVCPSNLRSFASIYPTYSCSVVHLVIPD